MMETRKIYVKQANTVYEVPENVALAFDKAIEAGHLSESQQQAFWNVLENITSITEWGKLSLIIQEFQGLNPGAIDAATRAIVA